MCDMMRICRIGYMYRKIKFTVFLDGKHELEFCRISWWKLLRVFQPHFVRQSPVSVKTNKICSNISTH